MLRPSVQRSFHLYQHVTLHTQSNQQTSCRLNLKFVSVITLFNVCLTSNFKADSTIVTSIYINHTSTPTRITHTYLTMFATPKKAFGNYGYLSPLEGIQELSRGVIGSPMSPTSPVYLSTFTSAQPPLLLHLKLPPHREPLPWRSQEI